MPVTPDPLRSPFDAAARSYDHEFSQTVLGREFRSRVWCELESLFPDSGRILELGCGTGEDTVWLAQHGFEVLATDVSAVMLEMTRNKADAAGVGSLVETRALDLRRIQEDGVTREGPFDGVLSNFGPLNCVQDRTPVARTLAGMVRRGAEVVKVVMGPCCPWEILWHLGHGQPIVALRRLRRGGLVHLGEGHSMPVWYPTPSRIRREFSASFETTRLLAIGCFLPPPYLDHLSLTRPALIRRLARWETRWQRRFPFTWCGDHFLLSSRRKD